MSMMNFGNPYDPMRHGFDPFRKHIDDKDHLKTAVIQLVSFVGLLIGLMIALAFFGSCTTTEYVEMPSLHTEHHWHTDSVHQTDSVIHEKTTTIMQLDSAAMAKYGIQLKAAERAWLVRTAELERQMQRLMQLSQMSDTVRDSIPYPVEVVKEVPAELRWYEKGIMIFGILSFLLLLIIFARKLGKIPP